VPQDKTQQRKAVLNPSERVSEILFGVIMVLTFTGSLSVAEAGRDDVRTMLIGALGCNLAWGLIDAILYVVNAFAERQRGLVILRRIRETPDATEARNLIADALPAPVASVLSPTELESMRDRLTQLPLPSPARLTQDDLRGALAVFLLVFLATFPIVLPFVFMHQAGVALRVSNGIAIAMLFLAGNRLGHYTGGRPWLMGTSMVIIGAVLVAITIALEDDWPCECFGQAQQSRRDVSEGAGVDEAG